MNSIELDMLELGERVSWAWKTPDGWTDRSWQLLWRKVENRRAAAVWLPRKEDQ